MAATSASRWLRCHSEGFVCRHPAAHCGVATAARCGAGLKHPTVMRSRPAKPTEEECLDEEISGNLRRPAARRFVSTPQADRRKGSGLSKATRRDRFGPEPPAIIW
jgi:hypothetical protein